MSNLLISPPAVVAVIGLGQMGAPMAACLVGAGFAVRGADLSEAGRSALISAGGQAFTSAREAVDGASAVVTMLPNGRVVRDVLLGENGVAKLLPPSVIIIDMSSSAPADTVQLSDDLAKLGLALIDAPVSGGVKRAIDGSLAIMAGGQKDIVDRAKTILSAMGKSIFATGPIGSGHAMKALNNYVSAAGLIAACEATLVGKRFGLSPDIIVDVLNASTGRNNSTELKMKPFVISEAFNSGFSFALMAKDLRIAADLAKHLEMDVPQIASVADLWDDAKKNLGTDADHTEIYRYLENMQSAYAPR